VRSALAVVAIVLGCGADVPEGVEVRDLTIESRATGHDMP
jgi:hypothetical protein